MAETDELSEEVKTFIVQGLACFDSPQTVAKAVKDEFNIVVTRQRVHRYDPSRKRGTDEVADKWQQIFEETRKQFLDDAAKTGIANKSVRLRKYQRVADAAEASGNHMMVLAACEAAAKEVGGAFTNRREHTGANGGPIETETKVITDRDRAKALAALIAKSRAQAQAPTESATAPSATPAPDHGKPA